jgi:hypothetical protein
MSAVFVKTARSDTVAEGPLALALAAGPCIIATIQNTLLDGPVRGQLAALTQEGLKDILLDTIALRRHLHLIR